MKRRREEVDNQAKILFLNIGGQKFTLHRDSILAQPNTKLAKLIREDKLEAVHGYGGRGNQYYFERAPQFFPIIHKFYRDGHLPLSEMNVNVCDLWDELAYWEINFPPRLAGMVDFFMDKKENVERYLDGLLLIQGRPDKKIQDLYLQSFPAELPRFSYHRNEIIGSLKAPLYEDMSKELYSLLEKTAKIIGAKKKTPPFPLKRYSKIQFMCPLEDIIKGDPPDEKLLHPLLHDLYIDVIENLDELSSVMKDIFPTPLKAIIDDYLYGYCLCEEYLRITHALYSTLIDGASLFDNDVDPSCLFARQYAMKYLDKRGVKSNWVQKSVRCTDSHVDCIYPLRFKGCQMKPVYKCDEYIYKHMTNCPSYIATHCFDIWYLHFEWPLGDD